MCPLQVALAWREGRPAGRYWKMTMFRLRREVEGEQVGHGGLFVSLNFFFFDVDHFKRCFLLLLFFFNCICYNLTSVVYVPGFYPEACGILAPQPGIEPIPSALEWGVLTTGPRGKSHG